jgi:hypothetical protein
MLGEAWFEQGAIKRQRYFRLWQQKPGEYTRRKDSPQLWFFALLAANLNAIVFPKPKMEGKE